MLFILVEPNALQTLIDVETKVSIFVKMLSPLGYEPLLGLFCLSCNTNDSLAYKLNKALLKCLNARVTSTDRKKTLD